MKGLFMGEDERLEIKNVKDFLSESMKEKLKKYILSTLNSHLEPTF